MLARDPFPSDLILRTFHAALRDAPAGWRWAWRDADLPQMIEDCARDLNLDKSVVEYLVAKRTERRPWGQIEDSWRERLERLPRRTAGRPRIIIAVTEGQAIRTFLLSDVCRKLVDWAELCVLCSYDVEEQVRRLGANAHFFPVPTVRRSRFDMMVMYLGYLYNESPTTRRMVQRLNENLQEAIDQGGVIEGSLRIWQIARELASPSDYIKAYSWSLRFFSYFHLVGECANLLEQLDCDLLFNTSMVSPGSRLWTRAAALENLPVVSNVISWDNMSTKTLLDEFADVFLIWSEEMEEDFSGTIPFMRSRQRVIVGSPQFEPVIERRGLVPRDEFFRRYGLDPDKKLILYTTGSVTIFPREQDCLARLLEYWRDHLQDRANLMVRMHPKDRQGRYEEVQQTFPSVPFTLAGNNLSSEDEWLPVPGDIELLVNQLHHCDLVVNVASTMTLEGFVIDKPAINIGFTLGKSVSSRYPMDDYYKSRHYSDIVDSGAARLVQDFDELFAAIGDILDGRKPDLATQRRILRRKCLYTNDSSDRISAFLKQHVAQQPRRPRGLNRLLRRSVSRLCSHVARTRMRQLPAASTN